MTPASNHFVLGFLGHTHTHTHNPSHIVSHTACWNIHALFEAAIKIYHTIITKYIFQKHWYINSGESFLKYLLLAEHQLTER